MGLVWMKMLKSHSLSRVRLGGQGVILCCFSIVAVVFSISGYRSLLYVQPSGTEAHNQTFEDYFHSKISNRFSQRLAHRCHVDLPTRAELTMYPYFTWSPSRFVAYYNIYHFLKKYIKTISTVPNVLDFGGPVFLRPFNKSLKAVQTNHPGVDIHETDFASNYFDIVCADQVLEHVTYPPAAMLEIKRILKPNGIAILTTVSYNPLHGTSTFNDLWRFMVKGLLVLSVPFDGGVKLCGSWGTKNFTSTRVLYGMGSAVEKNAFKLKQNFALSNDRINPALVWIVVQK